MAYILLVNREAKDLYITTYAREDYIALRRTRTLVLGLQDKYMRTLETIHVRWYRPDVVRCKSENKQE